MRLSASALAVVAVSLLPPDLQAQASADQARLMFSVGVGQLSGGGTLWSVGRQPFVVFDTMSLSRHFRRNLVISMSGTYFPGPHLGFNVEAQLVGLGTEDQCALVTPAADSTDVAKLCRSINRAERSATSASLSVGGVFRIASRSVIHPYVRGNLGLVFTQHSFLKTEGTVDGGVVQVYSDQDPSTVSPYFSLGGGVVAVIGRGYQVRFELRDNYVRLPAVAAATSEVLLTPPSRKIGKHLLTFLVTFDVVLERKRGRRY